MSIQRSDVGPMETAGDEIERTGEALRAAARRLFRRSLHIRQVDAGSCNACEFEVNTLTGPLYDVQRFGIDIVASPRHADMLLVTGPITRHLRGALLDAYAVMPEPRLVAAMGVCPIHGGVFATSYAVEGPLDRLLPVDVYIPGCPPRPQAILHGLLLALGRAEARLVDGVWQPGRSERAADPAGTGGATFPPQAVGRRDVS
ncbi:MAG TPA: NADH-quinone oxidoreductase subunit NuoB [Chloroflexota bacterium]|nr:NADH-quinone oxidoreductase subunit NuoB [Chloroflexota bacterium]